MKYLVTLCIPTNGVLEWCIPVIDSIYCQGVDEELFQVVVTDNGDNEAFQLKMEEYCGSHQNFRYEKTDAEGFLNQIQSFRLAEGKLIKFINHRMCLLPGSLKEFINYAEENSEAGVVYFSNGALRKRRTITVDSFDAFMDQLSYWSSWSAGLALWNSDKNEMDNIQHFNSLFPHTDVLFMRKHAESYKIVDIPLLKELPVDDTKKGRYNLFYAFGNEYLKLIKNLENDGDISAGTYSHIYGGLKKFLGTMYGVYILGEKPCSYDLTNADAIIQENFSLDEIKIIAQKSLRRVRFQNFVKHILGRK